MSNAIPEVQEILEALRKMDGLLSALTEILVHFGPYCFVCGGEIEEDDSPCEPECDGYLVRKLVAGRPKSRSLNTKRRQVEEVLSEVYAVMDPVFDRTIMDRIKKALDEG